VADRRLYGNTVTLLRDHVGGRLGAEVVWVDGADLDAVRAACSPGIDLLYCETIANPGSAVSDLPALAEAAHESGGRLVVDATIGTPYLCRPLEHGADIVVHSATKFLNGHHDVLAGAIVGSRELLEPITGFLIDTGGIADPEAAWLLRRGLRTFALRLERQCATATVLADRLADHPAVVAVPYPGRADHPDHVVARRVLQGGFGAVVPFVVDGGRAGGERVMDRVRLIERSTSIGGVSTGLSHPASTSHRQLTTEELEAVGVPPGLLRLAVGCEDVADLVADLEGALG
jgi:methionine-gamma-lyase